MESLPNFTPWKGIKAECAGLTLKVSNPTDYVVRLTNQIDLLPGNKSISLPKNYILPQETLRLPLPKGRACSARAIRLHPVTRFGILTMPYEVAL